MIPNYGSSARRRGATIEADTTWHDQAACINDADLYDESDAELNSRSSKPRPATDLCLTICATCPVAASCLRDALTTENGSHNNRHGIRGGKTPQQRAAMEQPTEGIRTCKTCRNIKDPDDFPRGRYTCLTCIREQTVERNRRARSTPEGAERYRAATERSRARKAGVAA